MHRLPRAPASAAIFLSLFVACGGDEGTPQPIDPDPIEPIGDPATYFGIAPCHCLEFTRADGAFGSDLGIAVERITDAYSVALEGAGQEYHVLRYRIGGQVRRTDLLRPTDPDLLLAGVNLGRDDWENLVRIDPPVPFLRFPLDQQTRPVTLATQTEAVPGGVFSEDLVPLDYRADFTPATAFFSTDGTDPVEAETIQVFYSSLPWPEASRHVVPRTGLVKFDLDLQDGQGKTTWILKRVRQLGGGCPWGDADHIPPNQICGTTP